MRPFSCIVVALLSLGVLSACDEAPVLPAPVKIRTAEQHVLPTRERLRAITARAKAANVGRAQENLVRYYNQQGEVTKEWVLRDGKKYKRPSTLPTDLTLRPLTSFLPASGTSRSSIAVELWDVTYDDTTTSGIVTVNDSLWTNQTQYGELVQDATDSTRLMNGLFFFYNTSDSVLTDAVGVTLFIPVDTLIIQLDVYGSDWNAVTSYMNTNYGYLRAAPSAAGGDEEQLMRFGSESTDTHLSHVAQAMMQTQEEDPGPCDNYESVARFWTGAAVVASGVAAVRCRGLKRASPSCWATVGAASIITTTAFVATTNYAICIRDNNYALRADNGDKNDGD